MEGGVSRLAGEADEDPLERVSPPEEETRVNGAICYYSGSGNTALACRYVAAGMESIEFDLIDITVAEAIDTDAYDVIGFAAFTDFFGPSQVFLDFVDRLPHQDGKLAFVLSTHGFISGKTLRAMESAVTARGFRVVAGHALHTPESYPPMIMRGRANEQAPNPKEQSEFDIFISDLRRLLLDSQAGRGAGRQVRIGLLNSLMPSRPRTSARKDMGEKFVDEALCTECGICEKGCPYGAIRLDPKPVFDMNKCYGCWSCYNHCPEQAIYTNKFRGVGHYPRPIDALKDKLRT